jgi:hypothetical protein
MGNPYTYFQAAEQYERKASARTDGKERHGIAFEEWKITLPRELSVGQNTELMTDVLEVIAGDALPKRWGVTERSHNVPQVSAGMRLARTVRYPRILVAEWSGAPSRSCFTPECMP